MKHVEIVLHFICDKVTIGEARILHVSMTSQFTDIFTKGLSSPLFCEFHSSLTICCGYNWDYRGVLELLIYLLWCREMTYHAAW
jgi:hypothetical protein